MTIMTIAEALRKAIIEEMERDPKVFCVGEDIGITGGWGGAFLYSSRKATIGLILAARLAGIYPARTPETIRIMVDQTAMLMSTVGFKNIVPEPSSETAGPADCIIK